MTCAENLTAFVRHSGYEDLSGSARERLKIRILGSLGCALGALDGEPVQILRRNVDDFAPQGKYTLIGGDTTVPNSAAFYYGALFRYLDFNDACLAQGETCHADDNLAAILEGAEYADAFGRELMTALAIAPQVQCRLSDVAPVRDKGVDHTTQGSYSVAAGEMQHSRSRCVPPTPSVALRLTRSASPGPASFRLGRALRSPTQPLPGLIASAGVRGQASAIGATLSEIEHFLAKERTE